ncbi:hypothetical protein OAG76_02530 [Rubripirellula sp.]|nr:hypothetical protein [Rubripirellula sp.]
MTRFHFLFGTLMVVTMALPQTNADEPATKASDPVIEVSVCFHDSPWSRIIVLERKLEPER